MYSHSQTAGQVSQIKCVVNMNISFSFIQLTALVGTAIFGHAVIQGLLFPEVVLICFAVSARTRTYPTFKWPSAQHLTTDMKWRSLRYNILIKFVKNILLKWRFFNIPKKSRYIFTIQFYFSLMAKCTKKYILHYTVYGCNHTFC